MAQVNIVRHNSIAIFSNPTEVIITDDNGHVVRLVEPSGNVGTQYANDVGSEWFGTIENLNKGLEICGVHWSDVYKTDVLWTTPSADRDECDQRKNDFNACYGAMIAAVTGGPLRSNRMARFTHPEGFPDRRPSSRSKSKPVPARPSPSAAAKSTTALGWITSPRVPRSCTSGTAK